MKLNILDLGDITGIDFFSYADYPIINYDNNFWMMIGNISDNHFSIGKNKDIDTYIDSSNLKNFTLSRYIENGGLMWYGNSTLIKLVYPKDYSVIEKILASVMGILKFKYDLDVKYKENYIYLNGNKIAGFASYGNEKLTTFHLVINTKEIPNDIRVLYKNKKFDNVSHLEIDMNKFKLLFIEEISSRYKLDKEILQKEKIDINYSKEINSSVDWIISGVRKDI